MQVSVTLFILGSRFICGIFQIDNYEMTFIKEELQRLRQHETT